MNEKIQRKIFHYLKNKNFVGVPDLTLKYFIDEGLQSNNILSTIREEVTGIASGITLSKSIRDRVMKSI